MKDNYDEKQDHGQKQQEKKNSGGDRGHFEFRKSSNQVRSPGVPRVGQSPARTYSRMNYSLLPQERTDARKAISGN